MLLSRISSIFSKRKGEISKLIKLDRNLMTEIMEIMNNESFSPRRKRRGWQSTALVDQSIHTLILSFYRSLIVSMFTKSVDNYGSKEETGAIPYFICTSEMFRDENILLFLWKRAKNGMSRFDRWMKRTQKVLRLNDTNRLPVKRGQSIDRNFSLDAVTVFA